MKIRNMGFNERDIEVLQQQEVQQRFMDKIDKTSPGDCWEWDAWTKEDGYGRFALSRGNHQYAHRVSFVIHNGQIPDELQINHTCDNRSCVNPNHLYAGTAQENVDDAKHRTDFLEQRRGENSKQAKLTADEVQEIKERYNTGGYTHRELGNEYGVSHTAIGRAIRGEKWAHLEAQ